ncbi:hypothetical protein KFZ70_16940 [Tamlana fucoidanivorans]|uniref:Toxin-antitoxin system YwqK family antitoxin n=1 Tax=Allotamlana fucoidanivorans TaxID=2583814 RepID=A0A5C4SIB4_9FLAO|nr:hypothetical protein [Tamlana fucoidanivorans]TNJ43483.1 hypothetical protein FGF67_11230 [Tamlana fucoidanivorans]
MKSNAYSANKVTRYFFKNGNISIEEWYGTDDKIDSLKTYYKSGSLNEIYYYKKGMLNGLGYSFDKTGKKTTTWEFKKGRTIKRLNHTLSFDNLTEPAVKRLFDKLSELNKVILDNAENHEARLRRAQIRMELGNKVLALDDFLDLKINFIG